MAGFEPAFEVKESGFYMTTRNGAYWALWQWSDDAQDWALRAANSDPRGVWRVR